VIAAVDHLEVQIELFLRGIEDDRNVDQAERDASLPDRTGHDRTRHPIRPNWKGRRPRERPPKQAMATEWHPEKRPEKRKGQARLPNPLICLVELIGIEPTAS
jgi:hypothetical protein